MAELGFGATVSVGGVSLAEVQSINVPELTAETVDVTTHSSTNRVREYIRGLRDTGEMSVTMLYTAGSASDDACITGRDSDAVVAVIIQANAASSTEDITFNAFVTGYSVSALEPDSAQTATLTLKPTGAVSQAATA